MMTDLFLSVPFQREDGTGGTDGTYLPEVIDVFRDTGEGGENREDDHQEDYLPGARQEGAADNQHERDTWGMLHQLLHLFFIREQFL